MTTPADIAIEVEGLTKSFDGRKAVRNLSLRVKRGQIYGFLGPNGSGKTTTIRMLCGLLTPDEGRGTCLGYDIRTQANEIKHHVGYMTQRFSLYQDLSVRENLEFVARLYGLARPAAAARAVIDRLRLEDRQAQLAVEPPKQRHHPFTRPAAANVNVRIVGVAHEAMAPAFQRIVHFIEQDVGQQRR